MNLEDDEFEDLLDELEVSNEGFYRDTAKDLSNKLKNDPYSPGKIHCDSLPEDVADAIEHLMYVENFKSVTIKIVKLPGCYEIGFEILNKE